MGAVETPLARIGNSPGVTPAPLRTPTNGCASAANCCSAKAFLRASIASVTRDCACVSAARPATATPDRIHARAPRTVGIRPLTLLELAQRGDGLLVRGRRGIALGPSLLHHAFGVVEGDVGALQGGARRFHGLLGRLALLARLAFGGLPCPGAFGLGFGLGLAVVVIGRGAVGVAWPAAGTIRSAGRAGATVNPASASKPFGASGRASRPLASGEGSACRVSRTASSVAGVIG